jgi:hypothetical protein
VSSSLPAYPFDLDELTDAAAGEGDGFRAGVGLAAERPSVRIRRTETKVCSREEQGRLQARSDAGAD